MGVRTPFYFVICVDDQEQDLDPVPQPALDAELYNYYYGDVEDEVDHDDGVYSVAESSCSDEDSLLDDIDSVYGDEDECDFDVDFPSFSKRHQFNPAAHDEYYNDYEDDEYSLPSEEWEETINDIRQELDGSSRSVLAEKRPRRRYSRRGSTSPEVL